MAEARSETPPFARIAIVGFGLIGGSIALAVRERWPSAPAATAARAIGATLSRSPVPWLGSTRVGRWLSLWTTGIAEMSSVLRV